MVKIQAPKDTKLMVRTPAPRLDSLRSSPSNAPTTKETIIRRPNSASCRVRNRSWGQRWPRYLQSSGNSTFGTFGTLVSMSLVLFKYCSLDVSRPSICRRMGVTCDFCLPHMCENAVSSLEFVIYWLPLIPMYSKLIQLVRGIGAETKITQKTARNATPPRNDPFLPTKRNQPKKKCFGSIYFGVPSWNLLEYVWWGDCQDNISLHQPRIRKPLNEFAFWGVSP